MNPNDYARLLEDLENELLGGALSVGIIGLTRVTIKLLDSLAPSGLIRMVEAVYGLDVSMTGRLTLAVPIRAIEDLALVHLDVLVIAADSEKEDLLNAALPHIQGAPKIILAGYGHLQFRDTAFHEILAQLLVPSFANGYPNSLVHIYQCLQNAARLGLKGVVTEFGMFKGGTTMFMAQTILRLGMDWPVIGFDTFRGFPLRRSPLDMYDHPGCKFDDLAAVQRYFEGHNVEIIPGDIAETCRRISDEDLVLSFIDTDNYSPARAALEIVRQRTVLGGSIILDHFAGSDRFRYTLGERLAGMTLVEDERYFHLHGTGVFFRQK